jgi:hypothetical protein
MDDNTFIPGPSPNTVRAADGTVLTVPEGKILLPPGEAGLSRRVKAAGEHWVVQEKVGRKMFSGGYLGGSGDHRPDLGRTRRRAIHGGVRQEAGGRLLAT